MASKNMEIEQSVKIIAAELQAELLKLESAYNELDKGLNVLIDEDKLYWNGKGATTFYKSCVGYFDFNKKLMNELDKSNKYIQSMVK